MKTHFIEPGSPWENGYVESLNGKLRDELLDREVFETLLEARVLVERWREHYNTVRPHSSLSYRPPAPETIAAGPPSAALRAGQQRRGAVGTLTETLDCLPGKGHGHQRDVFGRIVRACAEYPDAVMTVHSRGAEADVIRILEERGESTAMLHWYSGAIKHLEHAQEIGCYFSVNPAMTSQNGRKLLSRMARERVLTETDGPYTKYMGRRTMPKDVVGVIEQLAEYWRVGMDEAAGVVAENWARVCTKL